jgi:malate:Na+ symporter
MLGSLTAILFSGVLNYVGKKYPRLTGNGRLQPGADDALDRAAMEQNDTSSPFDITGIAAAGLTAIVLYRLGVMLFHLIGLPAPVAMLFLAVAARLCSAVSPRLQSGGLTVYRFVRIGMTYPLLFAIGVSLTPWDKLISAFTIVNLATIIATVFTLMATGALIGRLMNMSPIETAIVNACHSGQGGTGDVAILTAADRMELMPFAQIATRIGGAITVTGVLVLLRWLT